MLLNFNKSWSLPNSSELSMQAPLQFKARLSGYEKCQDHTWFTIQIYSLQSKVPTSMYTIQRTFNQLIQFSKQLKNEFNNLMLPTLQCKKFFLKFNSLSTLQKYEEIERYLIHLFTLPEEVMASNLTRNFFGVNERDKLLNGFELNLSLTKEFNSNEFKKSTKPLTRSLSINSIKTFKSWNPELTKDNKSIQSQSENGYQLKRSNSISNASLILRTRSLFQRQRTLIEPLSRRPSYHSSNEDFNPAPWNPKTETNEFNNFSTSPTLDTTLTSHSKDPKLSKSIIAPWNLKNLENVEQEALENLKPILPKRRSRILLGERGLRMRDFEMSMDMTLPNEKIKVKVILNKDRIVSLRVPRSIHYNDLIYKIRAKFLRNSYSCVTEIQSKILVYKHNSGKYFMLTNDEELENLMLRKPEALNFCLVNIDKKLIVR